MFNETVKGYALLVNYSMDHQCHADFTDVGQLNAAINGCEKIMEWCSRTCYRGYVDIYRFENLMPLEFAYPIYAIIFPVLLLALIVSNIFVVLVLSKKHMTSPTNTVLLYMAVADLIVGIVPFPFTFFYFNLGYYRAKDELEVWWCYLFQFLMSSLPPICHNVAIWLTVLLAVQRYVYIRHPIRAKTWCTVPNVRKMSVLLCTFSVVGGCLKFFELTFVKFDGFYVRRPDPHLPPEPEIVGPSVFCAAHFTPLVESMSVSLFYNVYMWVRVVGFVLAPCAILIAFNLLLISELRRASERRNRLLANAAVVTPKRDSNAKKEALRQKESQSTNLMLILVVSIFLFVNLPQATILAAVSFNESFSLHWTFVDTAYPNLIVMIDNMLILLSYPVNFAIYCSMSAQFRDTFRNVLRCAGDSSTSSSSSNFRPHRSSSANVTVSNAAGADYVGSATGLLLENYHRDGDAFRNSGGKDRHKLNVKHQKVFPKILAASSSSSKHRQRISSNGKSSSTFLAASNANSLGVDEPTSCVVESDHQDELL